MLGAISRHFLQANVYESFLFPSFPNHKLDFPIFDLLLKTHLVVHLQ